MPFTVIYTDSGFENVETERALIEAAGGQLTLETCSTEEEVVQVASQADALLVQWAPITGRVIASLDRCKVIVRIGIGVDNVDLDAADRRGITVCNVPDYCLNEVADHTLALALSLARDIPQTDSRTRSGKWKITPVGPVSSFSDQTFATVGFGRIGRKVLARAGAFSFRLASFDPGVSEEVMAEAGVKSMTLQHLFEEADILSLHCGLTPETRHLIGEASLETMKSTALIINTSRGGLVDTAALTRALQTGSVAGAGLDVYDPEPLSASDPIREAPNTLLTSHTAWYSRQSVPRLQELAAQEIVRAITGEPLKNAVNRPVTP